MSWTNYKLDPEGKKICELVSDDNSDRSIARLLGKSWTTYFYKRNGLYAKLREALKDYYR